MQIFDVVPLIDRRQIVKPCGFFMVFTAFPGFSLDITKETYNIDPTAALYEKKFPFRTVCFVVRRFWLPVYVSASGRKDSNGVMSKPVRGIS